MKHSRLQTISLLLAIILIFSCDNKKSPDMQNMPEYNPAVAAFTSGLISSQSTIQIRLSADYQGEIDESIPVQKGIVDINPKVKGETYWVNKRTLEFRPDEKLPSGQEFEVNFKISKLLDSNDDDFTFRFNTLPLKMTVDVKGLRSYSKSKLDWNTISGEVYVTDKIENENIETIIHAEQNGKSLPVSWIHSTDYIHIFTIDSVCRKETQEMVHVSWDGSDFKLNVKGELDYQIPALGDFVLMEHKVVQSPQQYISLVFSDPINARQSLDGLISLENQTKLRFTVNDNEIKVYPNIQQFGTLNLNISPGIQNIVGYKNKVQKKLTLNFEGLKPSVRFLGNGVILPNSEGLLLPFEAVNLKAVDVRIIKIYERNIGQFLQVNTLKGSSELVRAGRLILRKTIDLVPEKAVNLSQWNAFALDLKDLIEVDPGAIYRVEMSIRKKHSLYGCGGSESSNLEEVDELEEMSESELRYWDYGDYYYDYHYYNWEEKDDPCTDSYYNYFNNNNKAVRNVLASNIGIIAKKGENNSMIFAVSDLRSTEPLSGVKLEIYNYQQQILADITTDNDGVANLKLDSNPFMVIAKKGVERGYLTFENQYALPLSQFDVSGSNTRKGIKGFIYGERGVWRPGDSIFISFILEDKEKQFPSNHPVSFELRDPLGKVRNKTVLTSGLNGVYAYHTRTQQDDPTGNWNLKVSIGGVDFFKTLKVETIKPNRLKINLDFGTKELYSDADKLKGKLSVKWLHGAIAKNLKARIEINFKARKTSFKGFESYSFNDRSKNFESQDKVIFDSKINELGEALFDLDMDIGKRSRGMLNAVFTTRVFEEGGDFSIDQQTIPYSPYPVYVGVKKPEGGRYGMLVTDTLHTFQLVSLDEFGKPAAGEDIEVSVFKLNWRWWWHSSEENLAAYTGRPSKYAVYQTQVTTGDDGKGSFRMQIKYPEWGRYLVYIKNRKTGHSATETVYFDWPGWVSRSDRSDPQSASILPFSSDKTKYNVGETAKITIPTSGDGRIFLSIENGTSVLDYYWINVSSQETSFSFTVTEEMTPNVFVNVCYIQPHAQTKNDLPIRMFGVIPVLVENPETHLHPKLKMPEVLEPESKVKLEVSEENGKEMTYTVAIVDEGLLDLTRFNTPQPWDHFYSKEALGVTTYDLYNYVLGAYGGQIDGVFSIGGDSEGEAGGKKKANRFPPMVKFIGPFHLSKGNTASHEVDIPNYVGSVRTMVIAAQDGKYGNAENTTPVRKPLMVLATLPRVLGPGEEFSLPVTVFAMEDFVKKATVSIEADGLIEVIEKEKSVNFDMPGDETVDFKIRVKEKTGIAKFKIYAKSGKETAHQETELDIRASNPEVTEFVYGSIDPGESWSKEVSLPGMSGTNTGILEVFSIPPFDFGRRLKNLIQYPHGCIEQTTSAAFPQLYLTDIMEPDPALSKKTEANIKSAITRISKFTLSSGGFGYWPESTLENDWGTTYAGHFLLEAREKGYDVPERMIKNWIRYQKKAAKSWNNREYESTWHKRALEMQQAYRLYTLALAGNAELGAMNRMRELEGINNMAKWHLIGAYVLAGQKEVAAQLINSVSENTDSYNTVNLYTYGSGLRDKAIVLDVLTLMGEKERAIPVLDNMAGKLSSDRWYSTQTTAYCLLSISKYLGRDNTSKEIKYDYAWNNENLAHAASNHPVSSMEKDFGDAEKTSVNIINKGESTVYCRLSLNGIPMSGNETAFNNNLDVSVSYQKLDGSYIDISRLEQGTDFMAIVTVKNPGTLGYYRDLAITQIFPSGWEIQNTRMFESGIGQYSQPEYEDIRDDRVYRYLNLYSRGSQKFAVKLTAAYAGKFYLPAVYGEAMYRNDISSLVPGKWVEVVKPGGGK